MDYANIILEMLDRIKKLEQEVSELKKTVQQNQLSGDRDEKKYEEKGVTNIPYSFHVAESKEVGRNRDTTRFMFNGNVYLKNRLVLAVVKAYVEQNKSITRRQLKQVFDKSLQGSIGVVENIDVAELRSDYQIRFFIRPTEVLHLVDGDMYVCTQWGVANIFNFIKRAEQLGFNIEPIK